MMTDDIYTAICRDDDDSLKRLMNVGTSLYNVQLWEGTKLWPRISRRMTAVQLAVREGSCKVLRMLVREAKLDVNFGQASTALTTALEYKDQNIMEILFELGVQVNKAIMHGYSGMGEGWVLYSYPIHMAISLDSVSYLRLLLHYGADPLKEYSDFSSVNRYHTTTALLEAAKKRKHLHCIVMLQFIATLEKNAFGIGETLFEHVKTVFRHLAAQENAEVLLNVLTEMAGNSVAGGSAKMLLRNPLKLKQICRKNIRMSYRGFLDNKNKNLTPLMTVMRKLPLPTLLISYLLLEEEVQVFDV